MNGELKKEVERMRHVEEERKEAGVYKKHESEKTRARIAERLANEKTIKILEQLAEGVFMNKSEIRKQVYERNHEARRKKRMIVFTLKVNKDNNDREQVVEIIENMGVRRRYLM